MSLVEEFRSISTAEDSEINAWESGDRKLTDWERDLLGMSPLAPNIGRLHDELPKLLQWEQKLLDSIEEQLEASLTVQNAPTEPLVHDAKDSGRFHHMRRQRSRQDHGTRGNSYHFKPWDDSYFAEIYSTGMHRSMKAGPSIGDHDEEYSVAPTLGLGFPSSQDTKPYTVPSPDERSFVPTGRRVATERDQLATSLARDVEAGRLLPEVARAQYMKNLDGCELARFLGAMSRWLA